MLESTENGSAWAAKHHILDYKHLSPSWPSSAVHAQPGAPIRTRIRTRDAGIGARVLRESMLRPSVYGLKRPWNRLKTHENMRYSAVSP